MAKLTLVGCIAALSAVVHAQVDPQQAPTIFDRVDLPFTFTDCAAPTEMEICWNAQNYTNEYLDPECSGLQQRIDCALTNCWNRVCQTHLLANLNFAHTGVGVLLRLPTTTAFIQFRMFRCPRSSNFESDVHCSGSAILSTSCQCGRSMQLQYQQTWE